jgi:hypothetical protein
MGKYRRGNLSNIAALLSGVLLIAVVVLGAVIWGKTLAPGFKTRLAEKARYAPLLKQAGELGLTYEAVLADPAGAVGKPAVWCLRKTGADMMLYQGKEDKRVYIANPGSLPRYYGTMRETCYNALVTVKSVTTLDFSGTRGLRLEVDFVGYP